MQDAPWGLNLFLQKIWAILPAVLLWGRGVCMRVCVCMHAHMLGILISTPTVGFFRNESPQLWILASPTAPFFSHEFPTDTQAGIFCIYAGLGRPQKSLAGPRKARKVIDAVGVSCCSCDQRLTDSALVLLFLLPGVVVHCSANSNHASKSKARLLLPATVQQLSSPLRKRF